MKAQNAPAKTIVARLVATVSLAAAISGGLLAGTTHSSAVAGTVTHTVAGPALICGPDCPWDGANP